MYITEGQAPIAALIIHNPVEEYVTDVNASNDNQLPDLIKIMQVGSLKHQQSFIELMSGYRHGNGYITDYRVVKLSKVFYNVFGETSNLYLKKSSFDKINIILLFSAGEIKPTLNKLKEFYKNTPYDLHLINYKSDEATLIPCKIEDISQDLLPSSIIKRTTALDLLKQLETKILPSPQEKQIITFIKKLNARENAKLFESLNLYNNFLNKFSEIGKILLVNEEYQKKYADTFIAAFFSELEKQNNNSDLQSIRLNVTGFTLLEETITKLILANNNNKLKYADKLINAHLLRKSFPEDYIKLPCQSPPIYSNYAWENSYGYTSFFQSLIRHGILIQSEETIDYIKKQVDQDLTPLIELQQKIQRTGFPKDQKQILQLLHKFIKEESPYNIYLYYYIKNIIINPTLCKNPQWINYLIDESIVLKKKSNNEHASEILNKIIELGITSELRQYSDQLQLNKNNVSYHKGEAIDQTSLMKIIFTTIADNDNIENIPTLLNQVINYLQDCSKNNEYILALINKILLLAEMDLNSLKAIAESLESTNSVPNNSNNNNISHNLDSFTKNYCGELLTTICENFASFAQKKSKIIISDMWNKPNNYARLMHFHQVKMTFDSVANQADSNIIRKALSDLSKDATGIHFISSENYVAAIKTLELLAQLNPLAVQAAYCEKSDAINNVVKSIALSITANTTPIQKIPRLTLNGDNNDL